MALDSPEMRKSNNSTLKVYDDLLERVVALRHVVDGGEGEVRDLHGSSAKYAKLFFVVESILPVQRSSLFEPVREALGLQASVLSVRIVS